MFLLTGYTSQMSGIGDYCLRSKIDYVSKHGLGFHNLTDANFDSERGHPAFQKLFWILSYLEHGEPVLWIDADSLITNPEVQPAALFPRDGFHVSASRDYIKDGRPPHLEWSTGNMVWLPTEDNRQWLEQAMKDDACRWGGLWDQEALQKCQPDGIVDIREPRLLNAVHPVFGYEASWQRGDFLCHFTGIERENRLGIAQKFVSTYFPRKRQQ